MSDRISRILAKFYPIFWCGSPTMKIDDFRTQLWEWKFSLIWKPPQNIRQPQIYDNPKKGNDPKTKTTQRERQKLISQPQNEDVPNMKMAIRMKDPKWKTINKMKTTQKWIQPPKWKRERLCLWIYWESHSLNKYEVLLLRCIKSDLVREGFKMK